MVQDSLGRTIEYARISLTEACNFACPYCRPNGADHMMDHKLLSIDEWLKIFRALQVLGIKAIRLTGGEPLLYPHIETLIRRSKEEGLFEDISLTTNASMLAKKAKALKEAGLNRVNISLDGLTEGLFKKRTGNCGSLQQVLEGIEKSYAVGLSPIKINTVLSEAFTLEETKAFLEYISKWPVVWRFIEYMPFQGQAYRGPSFTEWKARLEEVAGGELVATNVDKGFGPAQYFKLPNGSKVGFIFPMSNPYCEKCNRIRITSEGKVRLCLLRNEEFPLVEEDFHSISSHVLAMRIQSFLQARHEKHDGFMSKPEKDMWKIGG